MDSIIRKVREFQKGAEPKSNCTIVHEEQQMNAVSTNLNSPQKRARDLVSNEHIKYLRNTCSTVTKRQELLEYSKLYDWAVLLYHLKNMNGIHFETSSPIHFSNFQNKLSCFLEVMNVQRPGVLYRSCFVLFWNSWCQLTTHKSSNCQ